MLLTTGMRGVVMATEASRSRKASAAGRINAQWNGADTANGSARLAPMPLRISQALSTAALAPEITVCLGSLKFAADTTAPVSAAARAQPSTTAAGSSPRMAAIAPAPTGTACCIACARKRTSGNASDSVSAPAATSAVYSPSEWPASAAAPAPPSARQAR